MNFKRLVALEVHLRLTDYLKGFVYSVRRAWFYKRLMSLRIPLGPIVGAA